MGIMTLLFVLTVFFLYKPIQRTFIYCFTYLVLTMLLIIVPWGYTIHAHWVSLIKPQVRSKKKQSKIDYSLIFEDQINKQGLGGHDSNGLLSSSSQDEINVDKHNHSCNSEVILCDANREDNSSSDDGIDADIYPSLDSSTIRGSKRESHRYSSKHRGPANSIRR